jgi:CheY-like chemotaxis protein
MEFRNTRVLIADDDPAMRGLLMRVLDGLCLEVIETHDAMNALVIAHEKMPDLIILDIGMPGGNGLSACEMLASDPALASVPVIILTGKSDDATLMRCRSIGARYICKGAEAMEQVRSAVQHMLCLGNDQAAEKPELYVG